MLRPCGRQADPLGYTALHRVAQYGHTGCAMVLANHEVAVDPVAPHEGWTPFMLACLHGHVEVARLLLQLGCDIEVANVAGRRAIEYAAELEMTDILVLLQKHERNTMASYRAQVAADNRCRLSLPPPAVFRRRVPTHDACPGATH